MALPLYLAMTEAEIIKNPPPENLAYMACHFSSYGAGLSDLPDRLPQGSMLILNDRTPVWKHDPDLIAAQLQDAAQQLRCSGILLDFQRPDCPQTAAIAQAAVAIRVCPVGVTEPYAAELNCPVFLSAPPPDCCPQTYISKWTGREIWLEAAWESRRITVGSDGCFSKTISYEQPALPCHRDDRLCCSYHIALTKEQAVFTVSRTPEDMKSLMEKAQSLGVTRMIGLYQQLGFAKKNPAD